MKEIKIKNPPGRPSKIKNINLETVTKLASDGYEKFKIAARLGISRMTLNRYEKNASFRYALEDGMAIANGEVRKSVFNRANGYSHPEEKIMLGPRGKVIRVKTVKHYPPDTEAGKFWLTNRDPKNWKDRIEHTGAGGEPLTLRLVRYSDVVAIPTQNQIEDKSKKEISEGKNQNG